MEDNARRCALPGCDAVIETAPGRPERRYCSAGHRVAARQARRAATVTASDIRLSDVLPWLRDETNPRGEPLDGRPQPTGVAASGPVPHQPARRRAAGAAPSRARTATPPARPRRGRALAALGAAGIVVGGYVVTAYQPVSPPAPALAAPETPGENQWAVSARIALTSVTSQLDTIARTEEAWSRLPRSRQVGALPPAVVELQERKAQLERRQAVLRSQLDTYAALQRGQEELEASELYLRDVEALLAAAPPARRRTPQQDAEIAALIEQRDLRIRQRDARRAELDTLEDSVADAVRAPLPDDRERTAEVTGEVMEVVHGDGGPERPAEPGAPRPDAVGGRDEHEERPQAQTDTSAPPDPHGPRDETADRRDDRDGGPTGAVGDGVDAVGDAAGGTVDAVGDTAGGLVDRPSISGDGAGERDRSGGREGRDVPDRDGQGEDAGGRDEPDDPPDRERERDLPEPAPPDPPDREWERDLPEPAPPDPPDRERERDLPEPAPPDPPDRERERDLPEPAPPDPPEIAPVEPGPELDGADDIADAIVDRMPWAEVADPMIDETLREVEREMRDTPRKPPEPTEPFTDEAEPRDAGPRIVPVSSEVPDEGGGSADEPAPALAGAG